jgi:hypothetical protein
MEKVVNGKEQVAVVEEKKKKVSFATHFMNFLMYGGIIVILIAAAGIFILISYLTK